MEPNANIVYVGNNFKIEFTKKNIANSMIIGQQFVICSKANLGKNQRANLNKALSCRTNSPYPHYFVLA